MSDTSIFSEKAKIPDEKKLSAELGSTYPLWQKIIGVVESKLPEAKSEWHFSGKKFGWSFRIKDKKRIIIYLLPRSGFFKVAFVFGDKAFAQVMESKISDAIKNELSQAKKYVEGRGIRIEIRDEKVLPDIKELIKIKLRN